MKSEFYKQNTTISLFFLKYVKNVSCVIYKNYSKSTLSIGSLRRILAVPCLGLFGLLTPNNI